MLTKKDITRLTKGEIPNSIIDEPFIVMRERVSLNGLNNDNGVWQWSVLTSPAKEDMTTISREEGLQIIRSNKMSMTHCIEEGQIYELQGNPFFNVYASKKRKAS